MAHILITRIDTDCTETYSVINPIVQRKNINRIFAIVDTFNNKSVRGTLEVNLTPDEQELFNELAKRIASRISLEVEG